MSRVVFSITEAALARLQSLAEKPKPGVPRYLHDSQTDHSLIGKGLVAGSRYSWTITDAGRAVLSLMEALAALEDHSRG